MPPRSSMSAPTMDTTKKPTIPHRTVVQSPELAQPCQPCTTLTCSGLCVESADSVPTSYGRAPGSALPPCFIAPAAAADTSNGILGARPRLCKARMYS